MNSTEKKHLMDGENVNLIKLYGESLIFNIKCLCNSVSYI